MLAAQTLFVELERFCDPLAAVFMGSPTTRDQARHRWAHAFRGYMSEVEDRVANAIAPPRATIAVGFADAVESAFYAQLRLAWAMTARIEAEDFADAWRAGVRAIRAGTGGTEPPATVVHAFAAWTPTRPSRDIVDERRDRLADDLTPLFQAPSMSAAVRVREIADAIHRATTGLTATSTVAGATITYA